MTMIRLNIHEAKTHLSRYLKRLEEGEAILLCRRNVPIAEIRKVEQKPASTRAPLGLFKDQIEIHDSFFDPLPEELLAAFEGRKEED